jgi:hypothetical protein
MGRTAAKLSLLFALFLCPALISQTPGGVEGVVVDSKTGVPLPGVSVYFGSDKGPHYETETDPSGQFRIAGMANGDYGCHFEKSGYISQYSGSENSPLKPVHIAASQEPVRLTVSLLTHAKLRGRVLDPEGKPVAYAKVNLASQDETTDDQGQFSFSQIVPGSYTLKAAPGKSQVLVIPDGGLKRVPGTPKPETPPGAERTELLPTWYPSVTQADLAEPVVVRGGDDLFGIEIRLRSLPVYRVRGKAFNLDGTPVRAGSITSFSQADLAVAASIFGGKTGGGGLLGYFTLSRSAVPSPADGPGGIIRDGSFELTSVPRGLRQFRVTPMAVDLDQLREQIEQARKQGLALTELPAAAPAVIQVFTVSVVVDHDIDDLEIRAEPAITIEATVGLADTTPDNTPAPVRNAPVTIDGLGTLARGGKRTGNSFRFDNVTPGEVRVEAAPGVAGGYYLSSVSLGGQDITWKPVNVQAGSPPISVIYKPNAGTVTGTVESAGANSVVLIPQSAVDADDVQYGRVAPLAPGGSFEIDSLAPGSYYAFAVDRLQPEMLDNRATLGRIAAAAALVHVTEGAAISIKPPLVRLDD